MTISSSRSTARASTGFRITERDRRIIRAVYDYRALTTRQIERLFFSGGNGDSGRTTPPSWHDGKINTRCQRRLQILHDAGFLCRDEQAQKLSEGRRPYVYFLAERGAELVAEALGRWPDWKAGDNALGDAHVDHLLFTNDVRIAFAAAAPHYGVEIERWIDDQDLRKKQNRDRVEIEGPRGKKIKRSIVPDGYFHILVDRAGSPFHAHCFLEADRGTVTGRTSQGRGRDWRQKVQAYIEYAASGAFKKRYGATSFRTLTVTTTEDRLRHLKQIAEQAGGKRRFWFTTMDRVGPDTVFHAAIWFVATESRPRSILK